MEESGPVLMVLGNHGGLKKGSHSGIFQKDSIFKRLSL